MSTSLGRQWLSTIVLCTSLVIVSVVFGARVAYSTGVYWSIACIQFTAICLSAWGVGAWAVRAGPEQRRRVAAAGGLLVTPWALFSFLAGIGPPGVQSHAENELRYTILLINAIAVAGGFIVLRETLSDAGERLLSTLGFGAMMAATPLYLVWASIALAIYRAARASGAAEVPPAFSALADLSDILLFFGGGMTYLATAAFSLSLGMAGWLGRTAAGAFGAVAVVALLCLIARGPGFPDPAKALAHWYSIPGFIAGVPAVPWIIPCLFGVVLLRRAGHERYWA